MSALATIWLIFAVSLALVIAVYSFIGTKNQAHWTFKIAAGFLGAFLAAFFYLTIYG